jgi:hypothetical protein
VASSILAPKAATHQCLLERFLRGCHDVKITRRDRAAGVKLDSSSAHEHRSFIAAPHDIIECLRQERQRVNESGPVRHRRILHRKALL